MAYESTAWTAVRQQAALDLDVAIVIPNGRFDAAAAGSITSSGDLRNLKHGSTQWSGRGTVIYRPGSATAADNIRYAGALTNNTGLLAHTGANYADTTVGSEVVELWFDEVRPDREILEAAIRVLKKCWLSSWVPVSMGSIYDFDMSLSTDTNWTDVGTPGTSAKATTPVHRLLYGPRTYHLINANANEGTRSAVQAHTSSTRAKIAAISSCNVGTASLQLYNTTGAAAFGTAITHSEESPQLMLGDWESTPSTIRELQGNLLGSESNADIFWNALWIYQEGIRTIPLPDFISEDYKAPFLFEAVPQMRNPNSANCWVASSIDYRPLVEGKDYHLAFNQGDAKASAVQMHRDWDFQYPLVVQAKRAAFDYGSITAESSTISVPLLEFMPKFELELIETVYMPRQSTNPKWIPLRNKALMEIQKASVARVQNPIAPVRSRWGGLVRV